LTARVLPSSALKFAQALATRITRAGDARFEEGRQLMVRLSAGRRRC
jgi:hypothetical protein